MFDFACVFSVDLQLNFHFPHVSSFLRPELEHWSVLLVPSKTQSVSSVPLVQTVLPDNERALTVSVCALSLS